MDKKTAARALARRARPLLALAAVALLAAACSSGTPSHKGHKASSDAAASASSGSGGDSGGLGGGFGGGDGSGDGGSGQAPTAGPSSAKGKGLVRGRGGGGGKRLDGFRHVRQLTSQASGTSSGSGSPTKQHGRHHKARGFQARENQIQAVLGGSAEGG